MTSMPRRTLIVSLLLACVVGGSSTNVEAAPATKADAGAHFEAAAELYAREDYAGAAREFAIAYALDPRVDTLFAWAQAERLAEHDEDALKLYERLLAGELSATQREAIEALRDEVRGQLAMSEPEPEPEPEPAPVVAETPTAGTPTRDHVGLASTGVGAGLMLLGGGLLIGAAVADARVRTAQTYPEFEAAFNPQTGRGRGAVALYTSGGLLAAAGLATLIAGAVRLARTRDSREPRRAPNVAILPALGRDQLGVVLTIGSWR